MVTKYKDNIGKEWFKIHEVGHDGEIEGINLNQLVNTVEDIMKVLPLPELLSLQCMLDNELLDRGEYDERDKTCA